jgi:hypothetical protein
VDEEPDLPRTRRFPWTWLILLGVIGVLLMAAVTIPFASVAPPSKTCFEVLAQLEELERNGATTTSIAPSETVELLREEAERICDQTRLSDERNAEVSELELAKLEAENDKLQLEVDRLEQDKWLVPAGFGLSVVTGIGGLVIGYLGGRKSGGGSAKPPATGPRGRRRNSGRQG